MYEDDIFSPDQEEIFKGDGAALQAINLTASTTGDLIFMCVKKSLHFKNRPWTWNTLMFIMCFSVGSYPGENGTIIPKFGPVLTFSLSSVDDYPYYPGVYCLIPLHTNKYLAFFLSPNLSLVFLPTSTCIYLASVEMSKQR